MRKGLAERQYSPGFFDRHYKAINELNPDYEGCAKDDIKFILDKVREKGDGPVEIANYKVKQ